MSEKWKGAFKVVEECGELLQVFGKLGPFPSGEHPDGGPSLRLRLHDEIADLEAALAYFKNLNGFDISYIELRKGAKLEKFSQWGLTGLSDAEEKTYGSLDVQTPECDHEWQVTECRGFGNVRRTCRKCGEEK